jgi:hypothetical protein
MSKANGILSKAIQATKGDKLNWEPVRRDSFRVQVGKIFLDISRGDDGFTFGIYDKDDNLLEASSGTYLSGEDGLFLGENELYELARRAALSVDQALEILDRQLSELI